MPDEPTSSGGEPTSGTDEGENTGAAPPYGEDAYRWHGPSPHAYPGAEAYRPYGSPYGSYPTGQNPYGPQNPYGNQSPYGQQGPYRQPNPYEQPYGQQGPYGHQGPYAEQGPYGPSQSPPYGWPYQPAPPRRSLSPDERRRRNRRALALGGVIILAVGSGIGIGAAVAPTSPSSVATRLVSGAITAATDAGTYHYVERSTTLGVPYDIAGDAALDEGRQVILERCSGGTTYFDLRLVQGAVYFKGTRIAVVDQLGVPAGNAPSVAGRWIKVVKGDRPYKQFAEGITTHSNVLQLRTNIIPLSSRTVPGSSPASTEVQGALYQTTKHHRTVGTAALVLNTATSRPRSLRASAAATNGGHVTLAWTFNRYGEKVHVPVPPGPLSFASLHTKAPAKGTCG